MKKRIYLICNSHLDPIWLWDRTSGRSAWLNTMHSVIRIMDENPDMKFTCAAAAQYRCAEECDPALFRRISQYVREGRWEIVGGWEVQPDVIISRPQALIHQALSAKTYFMDRFGVDVKIGYCVDSFGHPAGLPKILNASGFTHYVYMRGQKVPGIFKWEADDGSSVTAMQILNSYGTAGQLDFLEKSFRSHLASPLEHQAMFFGVGDHGGGISRKELAFIRELQKEYDIVFSTLSEYFDAVSEMPLETITGELGPVFRGCYSNCHEVKRKISRATRKLLTAEKLGIDPAEINEDWKELSFHHFHDILPGTSIRAAYEKDVFTGLGSVEHHASSIIDRQLLRKAASFDTRFMPEGGVYCWNPHPFSHKTIMSCDNFADPNHNGVCFNVLKDKNGNEIPLQMLPPDTGFGPNGNAWAKLTAIVDLPPMGENALAYGVSEKKFPNVGFERTRKLLNKLSFEILFDGSRTWGFDLTRFSAFLGTAKLTDTIEYSDGPACSILRSRYTYGKSSIQLDLYDYAGIDEIGAKVRLDWHDVNCCLKLSWKHGLNHPEYFTGSTAQTVCRLKAEHYDWPAMEWIDGKLVEKLPSSDEYSMIDWCAAKDAEHTAAFFTADLHSCDHADNCLRLTLVRPVMYSDHDPFTPNPDSGWMDLGVSFRWLWLGEYGSIPLSYLPRAAASRLNSGEVREITYHAPGDLPPEDFLHLELMPEQITLLELRRNENGKTEVTLINNGDDISIHLPGMEDVFLPANTMKIIQLPNCP